MKSENVSQLERNFKTHIIPLLSERDADDYRFTFEFEKLLYSKVQKASTVGK